MTTNDPTAAATAPETTTPPTIGKGSIWYSSKLTHLAPAARELLEKYSHIPPESVENHVYKIRDRGWQIRPYPCIGLMRFLELSLCKTPSYPLILERLKAGASLLDIGCCLAQDVRKLVYDGAPSANLYGAELEKDFLELGYELFLDRETFEGKFLAVNVFDEGNELRELEGKMDVVNIGMFLHLFDWENQLKICERIVTLTKSGKGGLVVGRQVGHLDAHESQAREFDSGGRIYRHNIESFTKLWKEIGEKTGSEWSVKATLDDGHGVAGLPVLQDSRRRWLTFEVERLR